MKKIFLAACIVCILMACVSHKKNNDENSLLYNSFKNINKDTLHISYWHWTGNDSTFYGKIIQDSVLALFDSSILFKSHFYDQFPVKDNEYYTIGKIRITDSIDGFIVRTNTLSMLHQKIQLCIYDNSEQRFLSEAELAELKGGESETEQTDSWIVNVNSDNFPDIISRQHISYQQNGSIIDKDTLFIKVWNNSKKVFTEYVPENLEAYKSNYLLSL